MTTPLDSILSGGGEAMPSADTEREIKPAAPEVEQSTEGAEDLGADVGQGGEQKTVPLAALHAEKQKVKRYTEQVASFEKKLDETNAQWERRLNSVLERLPQQQAPQKEAPDFFANPELAVQQYVHPALQQQARSVQETREFISRRFAEQTYGKDALTAAYSALESRLQSDPSGRAVYQQIMASQDPWDALGQWHKRETFLAEAGTDPEAYKAKLKAELLAELQQGDQGAPPAPPAAPVMPSNIAGARNVGTRSGPAWAGPTPLADIFKR